MNEALWTTDKMLEVSLKQPDDFLKVRETLSRIGVSSRKEKKLYQSCHILHKQGKYYIVHFKELFALDGKEHNITENDIGRRNSIASLLSDWDLIGIDSVPEPKAPLSQIKVISFKEKPQVSQSWINGGFFVAKKKFLNLIKNDSTILEKKPLEEATKKNQLYAFKHYGFWKCMDTKRDKDVLEEIYKKNKFGKN